MVTSCILALTLVSRASTPERPAVALQPLGEVNEHVVQDLARNLGALFGLTVAVLPEEALPESAYYAPRRRYRAEELVGFLDRTIAPEVPHVIGLTSRDISAPKGAVADWGVFGVAKLKGRPSVVSTYRLRGGDVSESVFATRLGRVAAHELAHALGLPHCATPHCLMRDAEGSIRTVDSATGFCETCARALAEALR